jgi:AraC-like DNA-binding protein
LHRAYVAYNSFGPHAQGTVNGLTVKSGALLGVPASQTIAVVAEPGYESVSFLVLPDVLATHLSTHDRESALSNLRRVEMLQVEPSQAGRLFDWGKRLVETATEQPALFNDSVMTREAARHDMLETLLETLAVSSRVELARRERTRLMQSDIVRAAEQHAMAHTSERIYVKDLCQAAGVGERSLEYAFRAEMGLSPTAYLTRLRLHRVREALLKRGAVPTSVTNEALRWGFWHFGEFAKAYRECFQELPSDTLRRANGN